MIGGPMSSFVYVLKADEIDFVKIGYSDCIPERIKTGNAETFNPFEYKLVYFRKFEDSKEAFTFEQKIHRLLEAHRVKANKEFFILNEEVKKFIHDNFIWADELARVTYLPEELKSFEQECRELYYKLYSKILNTKFLEINPKYHNRMLEILLDAAFNYHVGTRTDKSNPRWCAEAIMAMTTSLKILSILSESEYTDLQNQIFKNERILKSLTKTNQIEINIKGKKHFTYKSSVEIIYSSNLQWGNIKSGYEKFKDIVQSYSLRENRKEHPLHELIIQNKLGDLVGDLAFSKDNEKLVDIKKTYLI